MDLEQVHNMVLQFNSDSSSVNIITKLTKPYTCMCKFSNRKKYQPQHIVVGPFNTERIYYVWLSFLWSSLSDIFILLLHFFSPAPMDIKRPRLSCPVEEESENIIVAETPSPKQRNSETKNELKSIAEE